MQIKTTLNCRGTLVDLSTPRVMGILNLTPDSFFDGGKFTEQDSILRKVELMLNEGATFIDVGAASSRPGAPGHKRTGRDGPPFNSTKNGFEGIPFYCHISGHMEGFCGRGSLQK